MAERKRPDLEFLDTDFLPFQATLMINLLIMVLLRAYTSLLDDTTKYFDVISFVIFAYSSFLEGHLVNKKNTAIAENNRY